MLYHFLYPLTDHYSAFNLFKYITFRTAGATVTAIFICLVLGPYFIRLIKRTPAISGRWPGSIKPSTGSGKSSTTTVRTHT